MTFPFPVLAPGNLLDMVRSILSLTPKNGDYDALVAFYREHEILETVIRRGLCLSGELQVPSERKGPALVSCLWSSAAAYQAWVDERGDGAPELIELLELDDGRVPPGRILDVAITA